MTTDLTTPIFTLLGGVVTGGLGLVGLWQQRRWSSKDREADRQESKTNRQADREEATKVINRQQDHTRELLLKQLAAERETRLRAERREAYAVFLDRAQRCLSAATEWTRAPFSPPHWGGTPPPQPQLDAADLALTNVRTACNVMVLVGADKKTQHLADEFITRCRNIKQGDVDRNVKDLASRLEGLSVHLRDDLRPEASG